MGRDVSSWLSEVQSHGRKFLSLLEVMSTDWSLTEDLLKIPFEDEEEFENRPDQTEKESLPAEDVKDSESRLPDHLERSQYVRLCPDKYFAGHIWLGPDCIFLLSRSDTCTHGNVLEVHDLGDGTLYHVCCWRRIAHTPLILRHGESAGVLVFAREPSGEIATIELVEGRG